MATRSLIRVAPYLPHLSRALVALNEEAFSSDWGEQWNEQDLIGALGLKGVNAFVAERQPGFFSGFILARTVVDEAEILLVGVLPEDRGRGVATALLGSFLTHAKDTALRKVFLEVRENNEPARSLYKRLGFVQIGRRDQYYRGHNGKMSAAITLAKNIS